MICDPSRVFGYVPALKQLVRPGDVVVDVGAGPGFFSLVACQAGARRVYAIESGDSVDHLVGLARSNGFSDRIEIIKAISTDVDLPEVADVVVSDIRGVLPLFQNHIVSIVDARQRFLKPGGKLIPSADRLWVAPVFEPKIANAYRTPWLHNAYGLDLTALHPQAVNSWEKAYVRSEAIVLPPQVWAILDYRTIDNPCVTGKLTWICEGSAKVDGLAVWFEAQFAEGISYDNCPRDARHIYGQVYFPLVETIHLAKGSELQISLTATLVESNYVWTWDTLLLGEGGVQREFRQSTFFESDLSVEALQRQGADYVPQPTDDVRIDHRILALMDGTLDQRAIAGLIAREYPASFADWQAALGRVVSMATRYKC